MNNRKLARMNLMMHGVLFCGAAEGEIRKNIIKKNYLDEVNQLLEQDKQEIAELEAKINEQLKILGINV